MNDFNVFITLDSPYPFFYLATKGNKAGDTHSNGNANLLFLRNGAAPVGILTTGFRLYNEYFDAEKIKSTYHRG